MIKAIKIYTGPDGHTKVLHGSVTENLLTEAKSIRFKTTPPNGFYDWHPAPTTQYVVTLAGTLEFETHSGETFMVSPGDILIAMDTTGSGHRWKMVGDQPWIRVYVAFDSDAKINFVPDNPAQS